MPRPNAVQAKFLVMVAMLVATVAIARARADDAAPLEPSISESDREHWSFRPLCDPLVPEVQDQTWTRNAIDRFIFAKLEKKGLKPSPPADRTTLIRRVTLDLIGLPPTPEEVDAFVADESPDAYERLLDRLLASPQYGERWALHWLDLARYAETDGFEHDLVRPTAWKYRDWVIQALNADLPYDEFVRQQIAGDVLYPGDASAATATGFGLCGPDMPDINRAEERRHMVLNDISATVGSVFLGLQIGCAECHDHKFDPISQADFYRLRACFEPALQFKQPEDDRVLHEPGDAEKTSSFLYARGDFRRPTLPLEPGFPRIANPWDDSPQASSAEPSSPRAALARWLTRPDHPLTTRVIVNRLWQHHFGEGLSSTPSDFGVMGEEPTHPELLDWLASEFSRQGWRLKRMHKLMLSTATYRQVSYLHPTAEGDQPAATMEAWALGLTSDPSNRLLWHMRRQRLEGEAIRDCMLASSERLSTRAGGLGVMPPLPEELVSTLLKDHWKPSPDEEDHRRRSIYVFARRNLRYPLFEVFDRPDAAASCPRRARATIAPQSLLLLNSEFSMHCATDLAHYILEHAGSEPSACVELVYRRVLGRAPTDDEQSCAEAFLTEGVERQLSQNGAGTDAEERVRTALSQLCLALFNLNEFVYVD